MTQNESTSSFELGRGFDQGTTSGALELGPFAASYAQLFADALQDGVITATEREQLDQAASELGMSRAQLQQFEHAMVHAYELHHRVKVVERWQAPVRLPPPPAGTTDVASSALLIAQIEQLSRRVRELEAELREARSHVNVEVDLTGLGSADAGAEEAPEPLRAGIRRDPTNPELFARLYAACGAAGDRDGQFRAAQALVVLGAANAEQAALDAQHEPEGLITPQRALSTQDWNTALAHPELDIVTGNILSLVTPAALMGRVAGLRRAKRLPELSESQRHDAKDSTVMAVRALGWAATVLGMPTPAIYTDVERELAYAHVPGVPPYSLIGKQALAGRTQAEIAFLAARHMTYYRAEFFVKVLFSEVNELEDLFLAALLIGSPSLPLPTHVKSRVAPISGALEALLDAERRDLLRQQFQTFVADGGRTNLLRWSESIDKTACRAGLCLSGDLGAATRVLAEDEGPEGPLRADLLAFAVSERHGKLRRRLGIAID
jgi:hypothetical protein